MKKHTRLAAQIREIVGRVPAVTDDLALLLEAAGTLEENARIVELAAHPECPADLGLGGTIAWHRQKIDQIRHRPIAATGMVD